MALMRHVLRLQQDRSRLDQFLARALTLRAQEKAVADVIIERVVIALHDCFALAARNIILDSATGNSVTRTGRQIVRSPTLAGFSSPMDFIRHSWSQNKTMAHSW